MPAGWKPGVVAKHTGPLSYNILIDSGRTWKRHTEQLAAQPTGDKKTNGPEPGASSVLPYPSQDFSTDQPDSPTDSATLGTESAPVEQESTSVG